jgi:hypothetical protein
MRIGDEGWRGDTDEPPSLHEVADQGQSMRAGERSWCIVELTGPLADRSSCSTFHGMDDLSLARFLLRVWMESTRCECEE